MSRPPTPPRYLFHKPSNRAYVRIRGRFFYLGRYGSPESRDAYATLVADYLAGRSLGPVRPPSRAESRDTPSLTVCELSERYTEHAYAYYRKNGAPTNEAGLVAKAAERAAAMFGDLPADRFGPQALEAVRQPLIDQGLSRSFVNSSVRRIRRMFKWAATKELIPASTHQALATVEGLKAGRSAARETAPIGPVDDAVVEQTLPHLPDVVADMVRIQRLTGMRPGEVCAMRPCGVDCSDAIWTYRPASHKTEHYAERCDNAAAEFAASHG